MRNPWNTPRPREKLPFCRVRHADRRSHRRHRTGRFFIDWTKRSTRHVSQKCFCLPQGVDTATLTKRRIRHWSRATRSRRNRAPCRSEPSQFRSHLFWYSAPDVTARSVMGPATISFFAKSCSHSSKQSPADMKSWAKRWCQPSPLAEAE